MLTNYVKLFLSFFRKSAEPSMDMFAGLLVAPKTHITRMIMNITTTATKMIGHGIIVRPVKGLITTTLSARDNVALLREQAISGVTMLEALGTIAACPSWMRKVKSSTTLKKLSINNFLLFCYLIGY